MTVEFRSDILVRALDQMGDDRSVVRAMWVSTDSLEKFDELSEDQAFGRINSLMRDRHGTPFEHTAVTFYVEAPIFVFREWHRHRIGVSINEQSGRYSELPPMFYVPPPHRPLVKVEGSKQMDYSLELGTDDQRILLETSIRRVCGRAYREYLTLLAGGVVKEVARMVLPINIYSKMVWTCNLRSLMAFLSLRTRREPYYLPCEVDDDVHYHVDPSGAKFPSKPQWEIEAGANALENFFRECFPLTHRAFVNNGRVAP